MRSRLRSSILSEVQIFLPPGTAQRELQLPVWNALYQVRDFAQYVNWIRAKDRSGNPLAVARTRQEPLADCRARQSGAIVEYQIYVDSPGPFGAQLNYASCIFQSGADSDVSGGRAQLRP